MVSKKQSFEEHESDGKRHRIPIQGSKQKHSDPKLASISGLGNMIQGLWMKDLDMHLEPFLRRVVREEVESKMQDLLNQRPTVNQDGLSRVTPFELRFINKLPDTIFTHSSIIAEDNTPIQIALFDIRSRSVIDVGPLSCIKIEICALDGDFGSNHNEDWTEGEFNGNILRERDGKRPLLNGNRFIALKNGVGFVNKVIFTDNSRWIRSRKFRLGAKAVQPSSSEANIKEGRSEPFVVKDYRGESYQKHYPPSLNDDVWRLKQIAKDGKIHKRLSLYGIYTVKDFLRLHMTNPSLLYEMVGNIPKRSWLAIIEHAMTYVIDDDKPYYVFHTGEQPIGLLFNSIYFLVGVTFDGHNYCSPDTLTPNEKHLVEIVKQHAYKNLNDFKSIDEASLCRSRPLVYLGARQNHGLQQFDIPTVQEGHQELWPNYGQPFNSTSYFDGEVHNNQTYADPLPDTREMSLNSSVNEEIFTGLSIEGDSNPHNGSCLPEEQGGLFNSE